MTTPAEVHQALRLMASTAHSLPDGMDEEVREAWAEWKASARGQREADAFAEWIVDVCSDWGFPSPLGEVPDVTVLTPDGPGRLEP